MEEEETLWAQKWRVQRCNHKSRRASSHSEAGRGKEQTLPWSLRRQDGPADCMIPRILISDFWPLNL